MITAQNIGPLSQQLFDVLKDNDLTLSDSLTVLGHLMTGMLNFADYSDPGTADMWIAHLRASLGQAGPAH